MRPIIMRLDMIEIRRILEGWIEPVQFPHPFVDRGISSSNRPNVCFEMPHVDGIESDLHITCQSVV